MFPLLWVQLLRISQHPQESTPLDRAPPPAYHTAMEGSRYGFHLENSDNQHGKDYTQIPNAGSVPLKSHGTVTLASCGGSVAPSHGVSVSPSRGVSVAPSSRGGSVAPSHGVSIAPSSHGVSVALSSCGVSIAPSSHGVSIAPNSRGGSVAPVSRSVLTSHGGSTTPSSRAVSGLSFRSNFVPASHGASTNTFSSLVNGSPAYIHAGHNRYPTAKHVVQYFIWLHCASSLISIWFQFWWLWKPGPRGVVPLPRSSPCQPFTYWGYTYQTNWCKCSAHFILTNQYFIGQDLDINEVSPNKDDRAAESLIREHWHAGEH